MQLSELGGNCAGGSTDPVAHPPPHTTPTELELGFSWALLAFPSTSSALGNTVPWATSPLCEKTLTAWLDVQGFYLKPYVLKFHEYGRSSPFL